MSLPKYTAEIFELLSKGQFICSNSSDESIRRYYSIIDSEDNFILLYEYFANINMFLNRGDEYFYFSRNENKANLERKLEMAFKWIDFVDFLKTFDNSLSSGYRFTSSDIDVRLKTDADLKSKLAGLKKHLPTKEKYSDIIKKLLDVMVKENFIDLEDEMSSTYKVLASFKYLEQLILSINIQQDVKDEIPE